MCIATLALHLHPEFPFILIDNRDEEVNRPTGNLTLEDGILRVEDLHSHGTWMGVNTNNGNFAVLTNVEEVVSFKRTATTRGKLVDLLLHDLKHEEQLLKDWNHYNGFNLVCGNLLHLNGRNDPPIYYLTNRSSDNEKHYVVPSAPEKIPLHSKQIYCVSNSTLDDMNWKKVVFLKTQVQNILNNMQTCKDPLSLRNALAGCLCQRPNFLQKDLPQHLLQEISSHPHLFSNSKYFNFTQQYYYDCSVEHFANIFVNYKNIYKTVGQTIILLDKNNQLYYYYRRTDQDDFLIPERNQFETQEKFDEAWNNMILKNWESQITQL